MDVILPSHSLRTFAAAVTALTKIGKEGYLDFDPLDGLILRTLNDAKSAYAQYRFAPEFFERCSAPPTAVSGLGGKKRKMAGGGNGIGSGSGGGRQRHRKVGRGGAGGGSGRSRSRSRGGSGDDDTEEDDDDEHCNVNATATQDSEDDDRFLCRVNLRTLHAVLRSRKGVHTLRIRSLGVGGDPDGSSPTQTQTQTRDGGNGNNGSGNHADNGNDQASSGTRLQLSLEFLVESPKTGGTLRIVHRLSVSDAEGVTAVASRSACSELVTSPNVFLRLLDPLKRTNEVALTVDDVGQTVTATSFHHGDAVTTGGGGNGINGGNGGGIENNAVLRNAAASAGVLKTEASIGVEEFVEYHWRDDRKEDELGGGDDDDEETGGGGGRRNDSQDDDAIPPGNPPPSKVNEEVTLVFGIKEARAMLQFCAAASTDVEMDAVLCFHWGGRPVVVEAEEEEGRFSAELILATLDHQLVGRGVRRQVGGAGGNRG